MSVNPKRAPSEAASIRRPRSTRHGEHGPAERRTRSPDHQTLTCQTS